MEIFLIILGSVILFLLIIYLIISFVIYKIAFYNKYDESVMFKPLEGEKYAPYNDKVINNIKTSNSLPYIDLYTLSNDKLKLHARYYHVDDNAPIHICFHGYKSVGIRDYSAGLKIYLKLKHNVLVVDQRAHGLSEGHTISFGIKERNDVLTWCNYALKNLKNNGVIYLAGISMGAATVLMASELNLPKNVKGIVADCPYSSPLGILLGVIKENKLPTFLKKVFIYSSAFIFGHFKINQSSAKEAVKHSDIPILLIHGTGDDFVPFSMSEEIYKANPKIIKFVPIDKAPHAYSYYVNTELYEKSIIEFLKNN